MHHLLHLRRDTVKTKTRSAELALLTPLLTNFATRKKVPSVPCGTLGPVLKHSTDGHIPLVLETLGQLISLGRVRITASPHVASCGLGCSIRRDKLANLPWSEKQCLSVFHILCWDMCIICWVRVRQRVNHLLLRNLPEAQPSHVPTPVALRVILYTYLDSIRQFCRWR